jgi:hypothetical protein
MNIKKTTRRLCKRLQLALKARYIRFKGRPSRLEKAIKKANRLHVRTGRRYRVFFIGMQYHAWDRVDIKRMKRAGIFHGHLKAGADFDTICFHDTSQPEKFNTKKTRHGIRH